MDGREPLTWVKQWATKLSWSDTSRLGLQTNRD